MRKAAVAFFLSILLSLSVTGCQSLSSGDSPGSPEDVVFRDRRDVVETRIPAGAVSHTFEGTNYDFYVFEWWSGEQLSTRLEIRILSSGFRDHLAGDYETYFQSRCDCAIVKKGWVLVAGQKGREFVFTVDDGKNMVMERHFQWKNQMIQLQGMAPLASQELMKQRLQAAQQHLQLL